MIVNLTYDEAEIANAALCVFIHSKDQGWYDRCCFDDNRIKFLESVKNKIWDAKTRDSDRRFNKWFKKLINNRS